MNTKSKDFLQPQCHPRLEHSISTSLQALALRQLGTISLRYVDRISFSPQI